MENKAKQTLGNLNDIKAEIKVRLKKATDADAPSLYSVLIQLENEIFKLEIALLQAKTSVIKPA